MTSRNITNNYITNYQINTETGTYSITVNDATYYSIPGESVAQFVHRIVIAVADDFNLALVINNL